MEEKTGFSLWALQALASAPAWGQAVKNSVERIELTEWADEVFELILNAVPRLQPAKVSGSLRR